MMRSEQRELPGVMVQGELERAAGVIENLETRRWVGWVTYLFELLESRNPDGIEGILEEVRDAIETRLEFGRW